MKKRLISFLLVVVVVFSILPHFFVRVNAATVASGKCGENISWKLDSNGQLTISGKGKMDQWEDGDMDQIPWDAYRSSIKKVVVKPGITSVSDYAFYECYNLVDVSLPGGITGIGDYAFYYCESLETLTVPDGTKTIGERAFQNCEQLKSVTLPDSITHIGSYAFSWCGRLRSIRIPDGLSRIADSTFIYSSANTVILPKSVTEIGKCAFNCSNVETVYYGGTKTDWKNINIEIDNYELDDAVRYYNSQGPVTIMNQPNHASVPEGTYAKVSVKAVGDGLNYQWYYKDPGADHFTASSVKSGTYKKIMTEENSGRTVKCVITDQYGNSVTSDTVSLKAYVPENTTVVTVSNVASSGKPKVTWEAVEGASKYQVYRSDSRAGNYTRIYTTAGTSFTNTSAVVGQTYYYKVKTVFADTAITPKFSSPKGTVCDLARPAISLNNVSSTGKIKLSWEAVDGAVKYQIYRATEKDGTYTRIYTTKGTSFTNTSLDAGKTYYYKVRALAADADANSAFSPAKYRTCDLPRPVAEVALNSKGKPVITWDAVSDAVKYMVYIYDANDALIKKASVTGTKLTHSSAVADTTYSYCVVAVHANTAANSAKSTSVSIVSK